MWKGRTPGRKRTSETADGNRSRSPPVRDVLVKRRVQRRSSGIGIDAQVGGQIIDVDPVVVELVGQQVFAERRRITGFEEESSGKFTLHGEIPVDVLRQTHGLLALPPIDRAVVVEGGVDQSRMRPRAHAVVQLKGGCDDAALITAAGGRAEESESIEMRRPAGDLEWRIADADAGSQTFRDSGRSKRDPVQVSREARTAKVVFKGAISIEQ